MLLNQRKKPYIELLLINKIHGKKIRQRLSLTDYWANNPR